MTPSEVAGELPLSTASQVDRAAVDEMSEALSGETSLGDTRRLKNCRLSNRHGAGERPALGRRRGYGDERELVPMVSSQGTLR